MTEKYTKKTGHEPDIQFDAQASFRVEQELKKKVIEAAAVFDQDESWGWRYLAAIALGDDAPESYKTKLSLMGLKKQ